MGRQELILSEILKELNSVWLFGGGGGVMLCRSWWEELGEMQNLRAAVRLRSFMLKA